MPRPRGRKCGTVSGYRGGCRCAECTAAKTAAHRDYVARVRERDGLTPTQKIRGVAESVACGSCGKAMYRPRSDAPTCKACRMRAKRAVYIHPDIRRSIYVRDGWTCGFCGEAVEDGLPSSSPWQATLDHIIPRSLGGSDDASNLRLLHRYCNAVRSNREALTIEELAAS